MFSWQEWLIAAIPITLIAIAIFALAALENAL
jgi:hypothetical protein